MKRTFISLAYLFSVCMSAYGQKAPAQLSAFTRQYLSAIQSAPNPTKPLQGYVYKQINGAPYISALIKVGTTVDEAALQGLGVFVGTKAGSVWTIQIPLGKVPDVAQVAGITHLDLDAPVFPTLDAARKATKADSAQRGFNLPMPFTGKNVLVGIIDAGFDFGHPTLYDTLHAAYRVKRVWAQHLSGMPPTGFAYGRELADPWSIRAAGYDTAITSHGTHVAGIAAGSGYGSVANARYRGMAYESDMAFVCIMPPPGQWAVAGTTDILDGMNYLYTYAASVAKPCIVNLSWGSSIGPHDGHSLFSQACDALTGPGRIFACSAGNNGEDTIHLQKTFTTTNNSVSTFVTFSEYLDTNNKKTWVDMWGDTGKSFCVNVKLYDGAVAIDSTGPICIADTTHNYILTGSDGDPCYVAVSMVASEYNGKPHAFLSFHSYTPDNICLTTTATSGTINMWEGYVFPPTGYYGALKKLGYSWAVSGDTRMTTSDISSSYSAISVGAYTSKGSFTNISGATLGFSGALNGRIAPFSSMGPTEDNRTKPDITGPGFGLVSGVSSFDTSYSPGGDNYSSVISATTIAGTVYPYAIAGGTSMSSPAVSGIIALMLQMNSLLTPDSVKSIMKQTAIKDGFTGTIPAAGSTTWGHGKINAYAALRRMTQTVTVDNTLTDEALNCVLYPNPTSGNFTISYHGAENTLLSVETCDITGKVVMKQMWPVSKGSNSRQFTPGNLPNGLYLTRISSGGKSCVIKMLVN